MKEKLNAIAASINLHALLDNHRSMTGFGKFLEEYRNEELMRRVTFRNEPVDCVLAAIKHLQKGDAETDLSEASAWLSAAEKAYQGRENRDFWHDLAEAVRLDIVTQLNGLRFTHTWGNEREVQAQLSDANLDSSAKETLTKTHKLLVGLLGFHLGRGLEINQSAIDSYTKLLSRTTDAAARQLIEVRIKALTEHAYLNPKDFGMDREEFDAMRKDRDKLQRFVNRCCLDGVVPTRPEFEEKIKKCVHYMAGLTIFAPPVALFAIPAALIATPGLKIADRVIYHKDQKENRVYYAILDEAHEWVKNNIKTQAEKLCPDFQRIKEQVKRLDDKIEEKSRPLADIYFSQKLKEVRNNLLFKQRMLGDAKYSSLKLILDEVEAQVNQFKSYVNNITDVASLAGRFAAYLNKYDRQLSTSDGRYHAENYESKEYDGILLKDLPAVLHGLEANFDRDCDKAYTLMIDIHSRLNGVEADIKDTVASIRNNERNQKETAEQYDKSVRRNMF